MLYHKLEDLKGSGPELIRVSTRCPHCRDKVTFEVLNSNDVYYDNKRIFGMRRCANTSCHGYIFFIHFKDSLNSYLEETFPKATIPFHQTNIPQQISDAFEESLICHANKCFVASAIMIRKTLEEICNERQAQGGNLYQRLQDLSNRIVLPNELKEGMQDLRLLGNDAAHVEAQTFNEIGRTEIEISIEFTMEILKAVYQYESLLNKIRSLKSDTENN